MEEFVKIIHRLGVGLSSNLFITDSLASSCPSPHVLRLYKECHSAKWCVSVYTVPAYLCSLQVNRVQSWVGTTPWTFLYHVLHVLPHTIYQSRQGSFCCVIMWEVKLRIWTNSRRNAYITFYSNRLLSITPFTFWLSVTACKAEKVCLGEASIFAVWCLQYPSVSNNG